ncbi:hypothetical protein K1719_001620 [Acacia pycnantha]|nr:hypothetical protein K1719_001620 [Acacia pycnantha]
MAASLVGGALLSGAFNVLLERLTPEKADIISSICGKKLNNKLLNHLRPNLFTASSLLNDAELKQFKHSAVKHWLDELKDAVYELEDLMDEISTRAATQKKVRSFPFASLNLRDTSIANKLEAITDRIEHILGKKPVDLENSTGTETLSWRPLVTSYVKVSEVHGRVKEKQDLIKLMFNGEGDQLLSVIPVVGMGGVGKTTLVQLVFNDKDVKQKFDLAIWVCVSEVFDLVKIAQTIMQSISPDFDCGNKDLNLLHPHLAEKLKGKKFLVVLDDVWNDKYAEWDTLKNLLDNGVEGCKILVTTRLEHVALMVKTISSIFHLNVLSNEDCLSIFSAHAFHSRDSSTVNSCLDKIGRDDVARKCKGLPLAAKLLGGLLRSKPFENWNNILKDSIWDSLDKEIIPVLKVSYYYLPPHLKQCFAYCSLFSEDYKFDKEQLILMWMAEGFLQPSKGNMTLEEVGYGYFDDLTSRSFFQPLPKEHWDFDLEYKTKDAGCFVMHDLIHELATHVAGDFYFRLEEKGNKIGNKIRHLSCNFQNYACLDHEVFVKLKGLRTFIGLDFHNIPRSIGNASHILSLNLKYLRTLSLHDLYALKIVPESIGEFIHLCYLDLSGTWIESLPDSICKLRNLQVLKLCGCIYLTILPCDMQDLVNLRHFDLSRCKIMSLPDSLCKLYNLQTLRLYHCSLLEMLPSDMQDLVNLRLLDVSDTCLEEMPKGLGNLKDLQYLSDFVVGKKQEIGIGELGRMSNLKGWIVISQLENVMNGNEAYGARMMEKHITRLTLSWSWQECVDVKDTRSERDILTNLQPHWDLEQLRISDYRGTVFSDWLGSPSYHKMTSLELKYCKNCCMLPPLGQLPTLKELFICKLEGVVSIGEELLKANDFSSTIPFPSLEYLKFAYMTSWEQWHSIGVEAFPKLQQLHLFDCPKLVGNLPCQLLSLETLSLDRCPLFSSCTPRCPRLQNLEITRSGNVVWQEQELHHSLRKLETSGGRMLEELSKYSQLQHLNIRRCCNTSLMIHLPPSLQHLMISESKNVDFVMSSNVPLQNLQDMTIYCSDFMKFTSDDMEALLPNLRELRIKCCFEMESFPEGIIVPSLRELHIAGCKKLLSHHAKWHLPSNITYLSIHGSDVKCFPEGYSLPTSLTTLELNQFWKLETLNCTELQHLTSLQQLKIMFCSKLEKLSGEKLPASLRKLQIWNCPLLEEKYRNKDEQLFHQISHIPHINLFGK